MGKSCGPPKCKTCGKEEWRHTCGGVAKVAARLKAVEKVMKPILRELGRQSAVAISGMADLTPGPEVTGGISSRKPYFKEKARERRAAEKAGLSVQEYRERQKPVDITNTPD